MHRFRLLPVVLALALLAGCGGSSSAPSEAPKETPAVSSITAAPAEESGVKPDEPVERSIFAMDTYMTLKPYGPKAEAAAAEALARIALLESLFSVTSEQSEIYAVNHAGGKSVALSEITAELIGKALGFCRSTGGILDISVYPILKTWGFTTGEYRVPSEDEIRELLERVDYTRVELDAESRTVTVPEGMEIDLGSIAKGYTSDQVIGIFREHGVTSALINLGGNVQSLGSKPDGSPWRIAVQDPHGGFGYVGVLESRDEAVITSGGYERYFEEDGETYWHIIDPSTGAPARSGVVSATIVSPSGTMCDALSTSLFIMGLDAAADYWIEHGDFEFILVLEDGSVAVTSGLVDRFSLTGDWAEHPMLIVARA